MLYGSKLTFWIEHWLSDLNWLLSDWDTGCLAGTGCLSDSILATGLTSWYELVGDELVGELNPGLNWWRKILVWHPDPGLINLIHLLAAAAAPL